MQPTQLGPYTIRSRLGRGGMGAVYEAEEGAGGRRVAVKTLAAHLGDDAGLRRRFNAEIETLKALRHPGIVQLLAFGEEDGVPYFAMELVPGQSLEQVLRAGRVFTWRETVRLALEVVRALKSAHDHGVVHRDLKPANLLLIEPPGDDGTTVKLADFGIARLFGEAGQTLAGTVVGTAEFMAPEQAAGKAVDHRADLYALGLVMFAMLTGRPPFHGGEVTRLLDRQRREAPPRVASLVAGLPPELDRLIDRLLAKDPAHRPANALAVGRVLTALEALPEQAGAAVTGVASGQPTVPDRPAPLSGRTPADATPPAVDQFGDTLAMPGPGQAASPAATQAVGRTVLQTGNVSPTEFARARTVPATGDDERPAVARNRFTTVEEIHRITRERAASERRRQRFWQGITAVLTVAAVAAVGFLLFRRDTAEQLHARIMAIAGDESADLRDARPLIAEFLARHAGDSRADVIREVARTLDVDALERKTRRRPRGDRPLPPIERDYRAAMARETESPAACVASLEAILAVHATDATASAASGDGESAAIWLALVRRQIDRLAASAGREREEDSARAKAVFAEAAELAAAAAAAAGTDRGAELAARRRTLLESLVELNASRPHMATAVAEARRLLDEGPAAVDAATPPPEPRP